MGSPSIDPELMIRMLVVGYVLAVRSERLICREVQVNLAHRSFCKLGIEDVMVLIKLRLLWSVNPKRPNPDRCYILWLDDDENYAGLLVEPRRFAGKIAP
jgi:hypothetical protein